MMKRSHTGKKATTFFLSLIFITCFSSLSFAATDSEGWTSLKRNVFINNQSLVYPATDRVSLWVKIVPESDSDLMYAVRNNLIEKGKLYQANLYEYSGYLSEIDCSKRRHREVMSILYDVDKNILLSEEHPRVSWSDISPGSRFEVVFEAVCEGQQPEVTRERFVISSGC
jgi:hypothetical protein